MLNQLSNCIQRHTGQAACIDIYSGSDLYAKNLRIASGQLHWTNAVLPGSRKSPFAGVNFVVSNVKMVLPPALKRHHL